MKSENAVYVLGTLYQIKTGGRKKFPYLETGYCDGYIDTSIKLIVVNDYSEDEESEGVKTDIEDCMKRCLRHELIHAFLYESGLSADSQISSGWATNEEMVDWFAIQYPKIQKVFTDLGIE